jgi:hypothetical protein
MRQIPSGKSAAEIRASTTKWAGLWTILTAPNTRLGRYSRLRIGDGVEYFLWFKRFSISYIDAVKNKSWRLAMDSQTVNPLLTAKIVGSYLRHHTVGASELPDLIATVHRSLRELGRQAPVEEV